MSSKIQSVIFDKKSFPDSKERHAWMKKYKLPIKQVHITPTQYRYRIAEPKGKSFRTLKIKKGLSLVIQF